MTSHNTNVANDDFAGTYGVRNKAAQILLDHDKDAKSDAIADTVGVRDQVVKVSLDYVNKDKNVAIPDTVGVHNQTGKGSINDDKNDKSAPISDTEDIYDQVVEDDDNDFKSAPIPDTVGVHDKVLEISLDDDSNDKSASIPDNVDVHDQVVKVSLDDDNNDKSVAIPGTLGVHDQVVEVSLDYNNNNKNGAIPGTVGVHEQVTEVDYRMIEPNEASYDNNNQNGAIPGTVGVFEQIAEVDHYDNNNQMGAIPGTVGVHEQVSEVSRLKEKANEPVRVGVIRLRGEGERFQSLSPEQLESYQKNGYLILPDALTNSQADKLLDEACNLLNRVSEGGKGITQHDIPNGRKRLSPVGRILATFEPGDNTASNPFQRRVARLGCGVHKLPTFGAVTHSDFNRSIADSLGYGDARITQSQLIAKLAGIGGEIVPHQDGCVSFTYPPSAMTFWYALEDTTLENGCLCVAPGSHRTTPLRQRLTQTELGLPKFVNLATPLWAQGVGNTETKVGLMEYEYQALEVKKGTLVLFDGNLMHKSAPNQSEKNRVAYTFNIIEGSAACPDDSYMKPVEGEFEKF